MNNKKVVFFLLILLVSTGLITFILNKTRQIEKQTQEKTINENEISIGGKNYPIFKDGIKTLINPKDDTSLKDLMKFYSHCQISLGIPLGLKQLDSGIFEITSLSPLDQHKELNLKVGDKVLGHSFLAEASESEEKELLVLRDEQEYLKIKYKISLILTCF